MGVSGTPVKLRLRRRVPRAASPPRINRVSIEELFGKLNYPEIPINSNPEASGLITVIYGDNGSGKTTILRLIYACLSPQTNAGLRSLIAITPFKRFTISFSDGSVLDIIKPALIGSYSVSLIRLNGTQDFSVEVSPDNRVREQESISRYERALRALDIDILFVDHNRVVQSTYAFLSEIAFPEEYSGEDADLRAYYRLSREASRETSRRLRENDLQFPLPQVVDALERGFRSQAFQQGAAGEQSAANVYLEIAKSIMRDRRKPSENVVAEISDVGETLTRLKETTRSYIRHGLLSDYPFDDFITLYESASRAKRIRIEEILNPFLDSIQRRIFALRDVHAAITKLEEELSKYLSHKSVQFHILNGLQIGDSNGKLDLDALSSGEKQLVFLMASAAIARSKQSLILIDEPELSLNYKWQRLIAGSLANISSGGQTQYILASHSIEIITRYVNTSFELNG